MAVAHTKTLHESAVFDVLGAALIVLGLFAFPLYFWLARAFDRAGANRIARDLRKTATLAMLVYSAAAVALLLWYLVHA